MDVKPLGAALSASPQITPEDIPALKALGFRSIVCNRPDGEEAGQPGFREIEAAARAAGMEARYIPVTPGRIGARDADEFRAALQALPGPVLAYCRSGARSAALWSLADAGAAR